MNLIYNKIISEIEADQFICAQSLISSILQANNADSMAWGLQGLCHLKTQHIDAGLLPGDFESACALGVKMATDKVYRAQTEQRLRDRKHVIIEDRGNPHLIHVLTNCV